MRNKIALVLLAGALVTGCGHSRPAYSAHQYKVAIGLYAEGQPLDTIASTLALSDTREARRMVRTGLIEMTHRLNNE